MGKVVWILPCRTVLSRFLQEEYTISLKLIHVTVNKLYVGYLVNLMYTYLLTFCNKVGVALLPRYLSIRITIIIKLYINKLKGSRTYGFEYMVTSKNETVA